jgi:hypothetical protein
MAVRSSQVASSMPAPTPDGVAAEASDRTLLPQDAGRTTPGRRGDDRRAEADVALARGLAGYVRTVAGVLHVSSEATAFEVSDTATAYVALSARSSVHPDRDLMLVWTEQQGWALAVETAPAEPPVMLAYLGVDLVPEPGEVARFVDIVLADPSRAGSVPPRIAIGRQDVGSRLARYVRTRS